MVEGSGAAGLSASESLELWKFFTEEVAVQFEDLNSKSDKYE
jgi:hypothetical protein